MSVRIQEFVDDTCELFDPYGVKVGTIRSEYSLNDVRIQINEQQLEGYYIVWKGQVLNISKHGSLSQWPEGFYDLIENQLSKLTQW